MPFYGLTCVGRECLPVLEIAGDEFTQITQATRTLRTLLGLEEKFDIVLENYLEYEQALLGVNLQRMLLQDLDGSTAMTSIPLINRKVVNYLLTARVYLNQLQHDVKTIDCEPSRLVPLLQQIVSAQYQQSPGFRLLEALGKSLPHRSLPVHELTHRLEPDDACDPPQFRYMLEPYMEVSQLRDDPACTRAVLVELAQMGALVNVTPLVRQHIEALGRVHQALRRHTAQDIDVWEQVVESVLVRARASFGETFPGLPGLALMAGEQRDLYDHSEPIVGNLRARRLYFQHKNGNLGFLSRRYVSGASTEQAV